MDSAPAPPADPHWQPPRLGIIHFLAWPLAAAFLFCAESARADLEWSGITKFRLYQCLSAFDCILLAAGVVGLAVIARQKLRGTIRGRLQPGHWLMLTIVPARIGLEIAIFVVLLCTQFSATWRHKGCHPACDEAYFLYCLAILVFAAKQTPDGPRWRVSFCVLAFLTLLRAAFDCVLRYIGPHPINQLFLAHWSHLFFSGPLTLIAVAWIAIADRRVRRDWLHFLGLGLIAGSGAVEIFRELLFRVFLLLWSHGSNW